MEELIRDGILYPDEAEQVVEKLYAIRAKGDGSAITYCKPRKLRMLLALEAMNDACNIKVFRRKGTLELVGILCFNIDTPWWADENSRVVVENLVLCVDDTFKGFGRIAVKALDDIARKYRCTAIISGSYLTKETNMIRNMYLKQGYTQICPSFLKVFENG